MQTGGHQHVRIGLRLNVIVGAVGFHVAVVGRILGVTPLLIFADGQRDGFIQHRGQHIDKRHLRHNAFKQPRTLINDGAH